MRESTKQFLFALGITISVILVIFNAFAIVVGMAGYSEDPRFNLCTKAAVNSRVSTYVVPEYRLGCYMSKPARGFLYYMAASARGTNER